MCDFVVTRGATVKRNADETFVSVSYEAPKKRQKLIEVKQSKTDINPMTSNRSNQSTELIRTQDARREQEVVMKRARFDVIKFGMSGFVGAKGEEAKINLAIKLGAEPRKNKAKNYKELKIEREKSKARDKWKKETSRISEAANKNFSAVKRDDRKRSRKKQHGLLSGYGVVRKTSLSASITNNKRHS